MSGRLGMKRGRLTSLVRLSYLGPERDRLHAKGVGLRILKMNLDTNDATGKLMLQIIGSIAEFERSIMLARQLEGIAKAKAEGKYRGGIPRLAPRLNGSSLWLTLARPEKQRRKS